MAETSNNHKEWLALVNPAAGNGRSAKIWPELKAALIAGGLSVKEVFTKKRGQATELVAEGVVQGVRYILVMGGDGTNHEAVNGIFQQKEVAVSDITYALFPVGSGNDWARMHRIPADPEAWLRMFEKNNFLRQDIGVTKYSVDRQNKAQHFANVAGMGYDAFVVEKLDQPGSRRNKLKYFSMIFRCLYEYNLQRAKVEIDNRVFEGRFYSIHVGICKYSGGGMRFVPHADPTAGKLAVTLIGEISKFGVVANTYRLYNGSIHKHPKVQTFFADRVRVTSLETQPIALEADGELLGHTPVVFELAEEKLKVVVPEL